jgi:membrane protease YdiL (CAAX protease family)
MSSFPGQDPLNPEPSTPRPEPSPTADEFLPATQDQIPNTIQDFTHPEAGNFNDPPLFQSWYQPAPPPPARIPNLGHLLILGMLTCLGILCSSLLTYAALHFHLYGISTADQATNDIHYTLGNMVVLYLVPFAAGLLIFPLIWHKSFFAGLQWNAKTALLLRKRLFGAATACFVLALADGMLMPGQPDAPIEKLFQTPAQAWLLFAFGVTIAPFFEEIFFRGILLPSLCTAWDWTAEQINHTPPPPLGENGHPQWSMSAMVAASILTSIPFAWMHAEQIANSMGPLILLYSVSLVLCWVRLTTRSLSASVMVHACYNFLLFSLMLWGTSGFQHLDKK